MNAAASLAEVISEIVVTLPDAHCAAWVRVLGSMPAPDHQTTARLIEALPGAGLGPRAAVLVEAWQRAKPVPSGPAVALALAAAAARYRSDETGRVEIAVSGPVSDAVPTRLTAAVAIGVIRAATRTLLVTSYAVLGVAEVAFEINAAADTGVRVDLLLETTRGSGGMLAGQSDGREALRALRFHPDIHLWGWATGERRGPGGRRGAMHAKVIAADRAVALLGSANLTDNAYLDNLEVGAVIHDRAAVGRLVDHFAALREERRGPLVRLDWGHAG
jgi:phosphatidylserine/phosphatidylglycerophosphate/cardiolipin synthase-like enzyme